MLGILYALITVLAWGTWLAPSQNVPLKNQQIRMFYVAGANLLLAFLISLFHGLSDLTQGVFWLPIVGGLIWAASDLCTGSRGSLRQLVWQVGLERPDAEVEENRSWLTE